MHIKCIFSFVMFLIKLNVYGLPGNFFEAVKEEDFQ